MKAVTLFLTLAPLSLVGSAEAQTVTSSGKAAPFTSVPQPSYKITGPGIRHPAVYSLPLGAPISLATAVVEAGGFDPQARLKEVYVIRLFPNRAVTFRLDATSAKVRETFRVRNGDDITVLSSHPPRGVYPMERLIIRH